MLEIASTIEAKVYASFAGGGVGGALGTFLLWLAGVTIWHVPNGADHAAVAVAAVPLPVAGLLLMGLPAALAAAAGYLAPHTHRPDLATPVTKSVAP